MRQSLFYKIIFMLPIIAVVCGISGCEKDDEPTIVSLGAELCLVTLHHERGLPDIKVYIKYNATSFPGYEDLTVYDTSFVSNEFAEACYPRVPTGKHWCVGFGVDSLLNEPVRGSVSIEMHNFTQARDTIIYVSEY